MAYYIPSILKSGGTRPLCPPPNYHGDNSLTLTIFSEKGNGSFKKGSVVSHIFVDKMF